MKPKVEIWAPLPPVPSGIADYVEEQIEALDRFLTLTLVAEAPEAVNAELRRKYRVVGPGDAEPEALPVYHIGNSPAHGFAYRAALQKPGVVVLHEWNLHELVLGFAVKANHFEDYRRQMRREHGERGSIAAETIATALGGRHWTSVFPLNADLLDASLGVVCLSGSTAARALAKGPGTPVLHLPHHALLRAHARTRAEARKLLAFDEGSRIVLAPGLGTAAKSLEAARAAMEAVRRRVPNALLATVGGGPTGGAPADNEKALGRVDLETLGDSLLAADVVLALRFPSRGETSGVLMRALSAGRAAVISSGSAADEDLPQGVVARVDPGPGEARELAAILEFLLTDDPARLRLEQLASETARTLEVGPLTERLAAFLHRIAGGRKDLEDRVRARASRGQGIRRILRDDVEAAASSLALSRLPANVFERLAGW